jgi:predicted dehydrogenase
VLVDKPFASTLEEAVQLHRLAKKLGRVLTVYHNRRFDADFQAVRAVVAGKELGEIVRFESHYDRFRPISKPNAWRERPGAGSGVLFDLAPHLLDHALALFGTPEAISADIRIERAGFVTDDAFDLTLHYGPRLRAQLSVAMLSAAPRPRFVLLGTKGSFVKQSFDPLENSLRNGEVPQGGSWVLEKEENWGELTLIEEGVPRNRRVPSRGDWREFYANVRDALLGNAQLLVTPEQALEVMKGLDLALESSRRKCVVAWGRDA